MQKLFKLSLYLLFIAIIFTACTPSKPAEPEIIEVTRIVEQTIEVTEFIEQTVIVTELVEVKQPTPKPTKFWEHDYNLPPEYLDAMISIVQHYTYLETKQCEAYYDSFSEWGRPQNKKEDEIGYCQSPARQIELISIKPYNYNLSQQGKNPINEPDDLIFFEIDIKETLINEEVFEHYVHVWTSMVLEEGVWKKGKGGTCPPQYGSEYWNR